MTLERWIAGHGPLGANTTFLLALDIVTCVGRMRRAELPAVIRSLSPAHILRDPAGRWTWVTARTTPALRRVSDAEVVERIGVLMHVCLTGQTPVDVWADREAAQRNFRTLRSDLPPGARELVVDATTARQRGEALPELARRLRHELGLERDRSRRVARAFTGSLVLGGLAAALVLWSLKGQGEAKAIQPHGLTAQETAFFDVLNESAQTFALMQEHTAAYRLNDDASRIWRTRVLPDDPRLAWAELQNAWARTLAGDRLTAEQILSVGPARLGATLGSHHPYTREARLELAATLEARGAVTQAFDLRRQADKDAADLFGDALAPHSLLADVTPPQGVVAHTAPNDPQREGFRKSPDGGFFAPLTTVQRAAAGRTGFRLHVVATGVCRVSVPVGDPVRTVTIDLRAGVPFTHLRVEGLEQPSTASADGAFAAAVSLVGDGTGGVAVRFANQRETTGRLNATPATTGPPYALTFAGPSGPDGCRLVWLEIPLPFAPQR